MTHDAALPASSTQAFYGLRRKMARTGLLAMAGLLSSTALSWAELPAGMTNISGSATTDYSVANKLTVNQTTQRAVMGWTSFNSSNGTTIQFVQPDVTSVAVNVVSDVNPSTLRGALKANGNVMILNTNGVVFGDNATVDVNGLVASTGTLDVDAFNNTGAVKLSGINANPAAQIVNKGTITVQQGGLAAFVAPNVVNNGVITAKLGKIALASGSDKATVDLYGDGLVELALDAQASKAVIKNSGTLQADGGTIAITAKAAAAVVDSAINLGGIVAADTVETKGGTIILGATNADIKITGNVKTAANTGTGRGKITATGTRQTGVTGTIDADGGAIALAQDGVFTGAAKSLKTKGAGTIAVQQNAGGSIQKALDALDNKGTGRNTVTVGAGTFAAPVTVAQANTVLNGAFANVSGNDAARGINETVLTGGLSVQADNVTVDGLALAGTGLRVTDAANATLRNNLIVGAQSDGIYLNSADNATVTGNRIIASGRDGVYAANSGNLTIAANAVDTAARDGIYVAGGTNITVGGPTPQDGNTITGTGRDGIHVQDATTAQVRNNLIAGGSGPGFLFNAARNGFAAAAIIINPNVIPATVPQNGANRFGIVVQDTTDAVIAANTIQGGAGGFLGTGFAGAAFDAIRAADVTNLSVDGNVVQGGAGGFLSAGGVGAAGNGIYVTDALGSVSVTDNQLIGGTGGFLSGASLAADGHGIRVKDRDTKNGSATTTLISGNVINAVGENGVQLTRSRDAATIVSNNQIDATGDNGIEIIDSRNVTAASNRIGTVTNDVAGDGILIDPSTNITLAGNTVNLVGGTGINVAGQGNGTVTLTGNNVTSLAANTGARFESGAITLSGINSFTGGTVGLLFDPTAGGDALGLTLAGNSIGDTAFTGQSQYYVELENGAFFLPGTPTLMNGTAATYDGQTMAQMDAARFATLHGQIFDFEDLGTTGLFFPPATTTTSAGADITDVLLQGTLLRVASFRVPLVTILGLPYAPGQLTGQTRPASVLNGLDSAAGLNAITSAAGGEKDRREPPTSQFVVQTTPSIGNIGEQFATRLNDIASSAGGTTGGANRNTGTANNPSAAQQMPASGQTAEQTAAGLNDVEAAAGGERTVGCWGGVYNSLAAQGLSAGGATPVTYSLNTSPVAQIADAANCGGGA